MTFYSCIAALLDSVTLRRSCCLLLAALMLPWSAGAAVQVIVGPTPIQDGDAKSAGDITVINEKLAFALAVTSPVPYGVPRGAIVDVAPVVNGGAGRDCVEFADFIPNAWSAWPNTYQHIDILERGPLRAVVRTVRDWGRVTITTLYTLDSNSDSVDIRATMKNTGPALPDLLSGLTLWPNGGYLFAVAGMAGIERGRTDLAIAKRVVAYDENWSVALHAPYLDHIDNGGKDMFQQHSLGAGDSREFQAWLQVGARGDLQPVVSGEIVRQHLESGKVRGSIGGGDGKPVAAPVIVVEKHGKPYAWVLGDAGAYELTLPVGDYSLYATAKNYSQSERVALQVKSGATAVVDFHGLQIPGSIQWTVTDARSGKPLDARLSIADGQKPVVEFLGRKTFFTQLDHKGRAQMPIAPGDYVFSVSAGGGFLSERRRVTVKVAPGEASSVSVAVTPAFDPSARHWYAADLHHHADQAEAVTPPADLARSQLAAGLDLLFVSDHDSTVNHRQLQRIADERAMPFIAGVELSASWGHFNAYPLDLGQKLQIDTATASVDEILREARRQGASVVQVNHPFIPYGYFTSVAAGVAPGGFNPGFELVEINADVPGDDEKVLQTLRHFWSAGHRYYLAGGTDTHDVWRDESGSVRTFVHLDGVPSAQSYAQALRAGHAYVSSGPLVYPSVMFGDTLKVKPSQSFALAFDLQSIAGLRQVQLVGAGGVLKTQSLAAAAREAHVEFPLSTESSTWFALVVEDSQGRKAYTDPIWVDAVAAPGDFMRGP